MSPEPAELIPLLLVLPLLAAMALGDMRQLRISNRLVLGMLAVFVLSAPLFLPLPEIAWRLAAAALVFVIGLAGFAFRLWGGGDVKALAALMMFLPSSSLTIYAYVFSASMLFGMVLVLSLRRVVGSPDSRWRSLKPQASYPMGVSIAMSGLFLIPAIALLVG